MKKIYLLITILIMSLFLTGCGNKGYSDTSTYRGKQIMSSLFINYKKSTSEDEIPNSKVKRANLIISSDYYSRKELSKDGKLARKLAYALGEGDLKYHFKNPSGDGFIFSTFSGTANLAYNVSYLLNLPANLVANIRTSLSINDITASDDSNFIQNIVVKGSVFVFIIQDIISAIIGCISSLIMMIVGSILGFLTSPIQTILDIIPCTIGLLKTFLYAITNFFY